MIWNTPTMHGRTAILLPRIRPNPNRCPSHCPCPAMSGSRSNNDIIWNHVLLAAAAEQQMQTMMTHLGIVPRPLLVRHHQRYHPPLFYNDTSTIHSKRKRNPKFVRLPSCCRKSVENYHQLLVRRNETTKEKYTKTKSVNHYSDMYKEQWSLSTRIYDRSTQCGFLSFWFPRTGSQLSCKCDDRLIASQIHLTVQTTTQNSKCVWS